MRSFSFQNQTLIPLIASCLVAAFSSSFAETNTNSGALPPGIAPLPAQPPANTPKLNPTEISFDRLAALDLPALKKTLEKAGWPRESVMAIIQAETERRFNPPFVPRVEDIRPFQFWHTGPDCEALPEFNNSPEYSAEMSRREQQVIETIRTLFPASDEPVTPMSAWYAERCWGKVPVARRAEIEKINADLESGVRAALDRSEPDWHLSWSLQTEARKKIEQILTKDELLDYDLRISSTAQTMRKELDNFQPTREEFLTIFQLRHPIELQFSSQPDEADPVMAAEKKKAVENVEAKIAAALGKTRYEEYAISRDIDCCRLQYCARQTKDVDRATVRKLAHDVKAFRTKMAAMPDHGSDEVNGKADRLLAELQKRLQAALGDKVAKQFLVEADIMP